MSTTSPEIGRGWRRSDGRVGLRDHVVALSTVALTDRVVEAAAARAPGALVLAPGFKRGLRGSDRALQERAVEAVARHPNVGAILLVTHDRAAADALGRVAAGAGRPARAMALMAQCGYDASVEALAGALRALAAEAERPRDASVGLGDLTLALECGGSDASSAVCANPAIGAVVERVVTAGGRAVISETAEFLGGEAVVRERARSPEVARAVLERLALREAMMKEDGIDYRGVNPTAENIEAGLTTLIEKTMGALSKMGRAPIEGCLGWGEAPACPGLHFMDTEFFSPTSLTGMVLGGAQATLFAMGVFNPSGNPLAPAIKICGNPATLAVWGGEIDVDVSGLIDGSFDLDGAANAILQALGRVAAGYSTAAERRGEGAIVVPRRLAAL